MIGEDGHAILSSACFQLGVAGSQITQSFSRRIEHIGLSHKQVGLLAVVDAGVATSQREIATRLHVAPSLVVTLVDRSPAPVPCAGRAVGATVECRSSRSPTKGASC